MESQLDQPTLAEMSASLAAVEEFPALIKLVESASGHQELFRAARSRPQYPQLRT